MYARKLGTAALVLAALGVSGCTTTPETPLPGNPQLAFKLDTRLPKPDQAPAPLFASGLTLDAAGGVFFYQADYALQPNAALLDSATAATGSSLAGRPLGEQAIGQQLGWRVTELAGAPLQMGLCYRQQDQWALGGLSQQAQRGVDLRWAPALADFDLQWTSSTSRAAPLDCDLQGSMRMPLAELAALRLRGRACEVVAPALQPGELDARSWSAALELGEAAQSTALRVLAVDPLPGPEALAAVDPEPGYELGLLQQLPIAGWQAQTSVAWRRPAGLEEGSWSTDASLRRQLRGVGVSASVREGLNSYWFLPETVQRQRQYELGLDLSRWVAGRMPGLRPEMGMSYQWSPQAGPPGPGRGLYEGSVQWKFNLLW